MSGAVARLRAATQALHVAVENSPLPRRVMSPQVTREDYRAFIHAHHAVVAPWASGCPASIRSQIDGDPAPRVRALEADLAALDAVPPASHVAFDWPPDSPAWWGALYVLEGSRLGARVVARHLHAQLGSTIADATAYLRADAPMSWPHTMRAIDAALPEPTHADAIRGAVAAFERFRAAFAAADAGQQKTRLLAGF